MTTHPRPHHPVLGASLKLLSVVFLAGMAACVKYLGHGVPLGETMFARSSIALLVMAGVAYFGTGLHTLKTNRPWTHAIRSTTGTLGMMCNFGALTLLPLVQVTTMFLTTPMFVTLLAMAFLGERIHAFRWTALAIGLTGAVVIVLPELSWQRSPETVGVALAFGSAMLAAVSLFFIRSMSGEEHAVTITFYFMLTATVCSLLTLPFGWVMPDRMQLLALLLTGLLGAIGQFLLTLSFRYAEASTVAPLDYANLVVSGVLGYLIFDELPQWSMWLGAPLVTISGLIIFWREYRLRLERDRLLPE